MSGTEWTEPGQGATVDEIEEALRFNLSSQVKNGPYPHQAWIMTGKRELDERTNLRLTGQPLTAEDIRNISEAK